ncbi:MAG: glycosyltransferase family 1 protein [Candidatus Shapirobacteria bacterium]|jgi:glycosyltransferase involved in cell wall biosynthesis
MIICIDITSIPYGTGVSNYTLNLVRNLVRLDKGNNYKLFFSSFRLPIPSEITELKKYQNVKIYRYFLPISFLEIIWNRLHIFPIEFFVGKCDIFHTSDWTQPPTAQARTITTVHDLAPFLFPQWQHPKIIETHSRKLKLATKKCSRFICVSQNTKKDLLHFFPQICTDRISVIYEAAEDKYDKFVKLSKELQKKKKDIIHHQYGLNKFILAQGTREPRKNLTKLIEAFNLFKKANPRSTIELAIAGKYGWGQDVIHLKNPSVKILGYIPEKDMVALHASALCLVYPSLYEGFGLPIVKSMKVGTPVIAGNTSSLPEVSGNAAILVDPTSVGNIAKAIENIVKSPNLRRNLVNKGYKQAAKFSWNLVAKNTIDVYNSL